MSTEQNELFYQRLREATGKNNFEELSRFFGVRFSTISDWKRRACVPLAQHNLLRRKGINPEWINTGEGEKNCSPTYPMLDDRDSEKVSLEFCPLERMLARLLLDCEVCPNMCKFSGRLPSTVDIGSTPTVKAGSKNTN